MIELTEHATLNVEASGETVLQRVIIFSEVAYFAA